MDADRLFKKFKVNWTDLKNQTEENIEIYLNSLINRVNINNPHYIQSLPNFYFYNLVKQKVKIFFKEIGFECKRCSESCCFLRERYFKTKSLGIRIFKEDYELLKNADRDLNGYIIENDNYNPVFTEIQENLGYGYIDIINKQNNSQCYYFDEKRLECKIYKYRPLVCFTYPFRFFKDLNELKILIFDYCIFIKNTVKNGNLKNFIKLYSYWEFWMALSLFLKYVKQYGRERKIY